MEPVNPSPESQSLWYYADAANQPVGPLPFSDLQRLAAAEVIQPETHIIEDGGTEWKTFASVIPLPACTETNAASAILPLSSAVSPNENTADGFNHHGKEAEEFFHKRGSDLKAFAEAWAGECKRYWKKAVELFDAYNCGVIAQADRRANKPVPERGGQRKEERQPTKKEKIQAGAFFLILVIAITLWHYLRSLLYLGGFLGTWIAVALFCQRAKQSKTLSVGSGFIMACVALALAVKLTGTGKNTSGGEASGNPEKRTFAVMSEQLRTATPRPAEASTPPPKTKRADGSPTDATLRTFYYFASGAKFKRGITMISTGGRVPAQTVLFPVRTDLAPRSMTLYFFTDEFDEWKCMTENNGKVEILTPVRELE